MTIKLEISNGRMVEASHEDLEFVRLIRRIENGEMLCELGVGTNPGAKLCGVVLEDEKVYGTVHIGFGGQQHVWRAGKLTGASRCGY
ncbi:hypothetical protein [Methanopyrus sp. SNP6]|uniref:hypothetical protein n=1 Tax=Methanopyrus sp. SNP6 TaxID=1937005 RepID=UPI0011E6040C|nr:hypothetical protein [Methanopyrus sp. SNP6]